MLADLVIVPENPLSNLKVLYGTGHMRLNPQTNRQEKVGGVKYTIKDGIVYDAQKLLAEVAAAVAAEKRTVDDDHGAAVEALRGIAGAMCVRLRWLARGTFPPRGAGARVDQRSPHRRRDINSRGAN